MEFIKELNINENTLNRIIEQNSESIIYTLETNKESIKEIIDYLKKSGIKPINELLIYEFDFFLMDINTIKNKLNKEVIENINNDYISVEELYN
jgi:hypothetical protein